jgi:UDP-N-acetyl-D-glucosamine dehydrogenase
MPMSDTAAVDQAGRQLEERLTAVPTVAVMGMGYVGLPVALGLVDAGCRVYGVDIAEARVKTLAEGGSWFRDVPSERVQQALASRRFTPTTEMRVLAEADAILICVPTPVTVQKEPDTSHISAAAGAVAAHLRRGQLVILRSTSYPGTTRSVVLPALQRSGLQVGRDVFLAFASERVDPGNAAVAMRTVPVVVGGIDRVSTRLAGLLLGRIADRIVPVSSPEVAEMSKLLENVFRNVNIALVNQVAQLCERMGLDVWDVVEAAATKPFGFMAFRPGLVGGHCIPVDPYFLAWKAREFDFHMDFVTLAARVNEEMPFYVVHRLITALHGHKSAGERSRVLILGAAFKKDVDDARHSPAVKVIELLQRAGVDVLYHDPYVATLQVDGRDLVAAPLTSSLIESADCVVILADHSIFDYEAIVRDARLVFDTRNATRLVREGRERIIRL